ncbi:uncharacterized protein LOC117591993 [Drosophila guanche]|uniref:Uncharacterized protein n=1 Tax=Drosophila guanche TaxID=7266 RepID=A0A3B0J0K5_DROGU|nr:uncharacterized protein LOC117591993 [Drosophila guanche]SPP74197.1 Hypothetical predicted protein [Drosophila guanche]
MGVGTRFLLAVVGTAICLVGSMTGEILQCFQCNEADQTCGSPQKPLGRIGECPHSTMCSKTVLTMSLLEGHQWIKTMRGCAQQLNTTHVFVNKAWVEKSVVEEPYQEGCIEKKVNPGNAILLCHCRGPLCNAASSLMATDGRLLPLILLGYIWFWSCRKQHL